MGWWKRGGSGGKAARQACQDLVALGLLEERGLEKRRRK